MGEGSSREDRAAVVRVRTESVRRSGSSEEERGGEEETAAELLKHAPKDLPAPIKGY